jgi:hypothetical protein
LYRFLGISVLLHATRHTSGGPLQRGQIKSAKIAYRQDDTGDESVPEDMDLFRLAMCRRIVTFVGIPRRYR